MSGYIQERIAEVVATAATARKSRDAWEEASTEPNCEGLSDALNELENAIARLAGAAKEVA